MINEYHTGNEIFNTSEFIKYLLKKHQKIRFRGADASHKNGSAERTMKMLVTMASAIFMKAGMICNKDTLSTNVIQHKWTMMYGSTSGSLIYSMLYKPICTFEPYLVWSQGFRSL